MSASTATVDLSVVPSITPGYRLQHEEAQDGWVLLYPEGMVKLNQSAAEILRRCDGKRSLSEVIQLLQSDFDQSGLEADVLGFIDIAREQKWVVLSGDTSP